MDVESGKVDAINANTEMVLNTAGERSYIFDHCWRVMKQKFVFPDLQGVDWDSYYKIYKRFLPYINNNYDFTDMLSELVGESNASHTGCYLMNDRQNSDMTASLGLFFDYGYTGNGLKIAELIEDGPLDKASSKVKAGDILEMIDGVAINDSIDFYKLLNRKTGVLTLLSLYDPSRSNAGKRS